MRLLSCKFNSLYKNPASSGKAINVEMRAGRQDSALLKTREAPYDPAPSVEERGKGHPGLLDSPLREI